MFSYKLSCHEAKTASWSDRHWDVRLDSNQPMNIIQLREEARKICRRNNGMVTVTLTHTNDPEWIRDDGECLQRLAGWTDEPYGPTPALDSAERMLYSLLDPYKDTDLTETTIPLATLRRIQGEVEKARVDFKQERFGTLQRERAKS